MQNLDVTQATTSQLIAGKKELKTKLQQTAEEKHIGFDPEYTWCRLNRDQRSKISWSLKKGKLNSNVKQHRIT